MLKRIGWLVVLSSMTPVGAMAQEPPPLTPFATIGRPEPHSPLGRWAMKACDKLDRCPCCAYGKTHNDIGVQSFYGTRTFILGSACEFFTVPCRTPPKESHRWFPWGRAKDPASASPSRSCTSCGH
jgi:hypothetical protein